MSERYESRTVTLESLNNMKTFPKGLNHHAGLLHYDELTDTTIFIRRTIRYIYDYRIVYKYDFKVDFVYINGVRYYYKKEYYTLKETLKHGLEYFNSRMNQAKKRLNT